MKFKKLPLPFVSFLQTLLLSLYVLLVGYFMQHIDEVTFGPNFIGIAMMLCLLVLSAAICGFLIFAYPVYLLLDKEIKKAIWSVVYTFLFLLLIILLFLMIAL